MTCICAHADPVQCSVIKYSASSTLIACLDATCQCACHYNTIGGQIPPEQWREQKEAKLRRLQWPQRKEVKNATQ